MVWSGVNVSKEARELEIKLSVLTILRNVLPAGQKCILNRYVGNQESLISVWTFGSIEHTGGAMKSTSQLVMGPSMSPSKP